MDIGFLEFLLVMIVGLLVLGPERMPEVTRKFIYWWGRAKRTINDTRAEIEREIGAEDIRRQLHNESIMKSLGESKAAIEATVKETTDNIHRFKTIGEKQSHHSGAVDDTNLENSDTADTPDGAAAGETEAAAKQHQADELAVIKAKKELAAICQAEAELAKQLDANAKQAEEGDTLGAGQNPASTASSNSSQSVKKDNT
jgi:sec-independent protein translocase protein TatB